MAGLLFGGRLQEAKTSQEVRQQTTLRLSLAILVT